MKTIIRRFIDSTGILLLAMATALFVANVSPHPHALIPLREPLLNLQMSDVFWMLGSIGLAAGWFCLFGKSSSAQLSLILWLGANALVFRLAQVWTNATGGFTGYLGDVADAFGLSCAAANDLLGTVIIYLLLGSLAGLVAGWGQSQGTAAKFETANQVKLSCAHCGGRIQFATERLGQTIPCPHCQAALILRKPELLKMTCFFCREHIQFPSHASGERIACPHCKMDITLKEPA